MHLVEMSVVNNVPSEGILGSENGQLLTGAFGRQGWGARVELGSSDAEGVSVRGEMPQQTRGVWGVMSFPISRARGVKFCPHQDPPSYTARNEINK